MQMFRLRLLVTLFTICSTKGLDDKVVNVVNEIEQENHQSFDFIFLEGCRRHYSDKDDPCWKSEQQRLWLNKNQPRQLTNLTDTGCAFLFVKSELAETLVQFWTTQKNEVKEERWPRGISYLNHWDSPTRYLELTPSLERKIYQTLLPVVEDWVGSRLVPTALIGIRVYQKGAMIAPHVERLPLVISCVMPLTFYETWPLELIVHDGTAIHFNVEQPGDIICYESHTVLHGRPIPLQGKHYASINVYFEPLGYSTQHFHEKDSNDNHQRNSLKTRFHELEKTSRPEIRISDTIPYYVPIDKQNAWRQNYIYEPFHIPDLATNTISKHNDKTSPQKPFTAWTAAAAGDLKALQEIVSKDPSSITTADGNGWYPIHEAARSGETEVIRYLVENGADVNARTNHGKGGTALFWVEQTHDPKHPAVTYLQSKGAKSIAPYAKVDNDQDVVVDDEEEDDEEEEEDEEEEVNDDEKKEEEVNDDEKKEEEVKNDEKKEVKSKTEIK